MKFIAYKMAKNDPNFPDGFITEHFETEQTSLEGYLIAPLDVFNVLFQNNVALIRQQEATQGVLTQSSAPVMTVPLISQTAEPVPSNLNQIAPSQPPTNQAELFSQFLAWLATQHNNNT